jgi:hypothetical protein
VIRYLSTFSDAEKFTVAEEAIVKKVLVEFMKAQDAETTELDELFDCPIITELKGTPEYSLLEIFARGDCQQFKEFADNNAAFFSDSGLKHILLCLTRNRH